MYSRISVRFGPWSVNSLRGRAKLYSPLIRGFKEMLLVVPEGFFKSNVVLDVSFVPNVSNVSSSNP